MTQYTNYTIGKINKKLKKEFMTACRHYNITARKTLMQHMANVAGDYRREVLRESLLNLKKQEKAKK